MPFTIGETVGPYRITEQLGQGGMATVFKAYHANLDRYIAIKVLHPAFKEDETFFIRFKREAQIVARLEHPHIVPIYDFSEVGEPYIVMKFVEGETLKHRFKRGTLSLDETLRIMSAVAEALTYAHNENILHRDVKPSNVMLDKNGHPYLADFGLARMASSGESTMSQDVLIGTPHYISPEQAKGAKELTPATDIYSLGIMLYEVVVGRVPFSADTPYAVVHDHIYKPLPMPSQVNPAVPPQIETVLLRALSKEPLDRYQSAVEMMQAFKKAVEDSNLSELSATSIRLDKFEEISTPSSTEDGRLNAYIRSVTKEMLQNELASRVDPAVPIPNTSYPSYQQQMGSSASRRRRQAQSRRNFWVLSGIVALIFICIASLGVIINTLQNPVLAEIPEAEEQNDLRPQHNKPEEIGNMLTVTIEEAEILVADNPNNAEANMTLAFAYFRAGRIEEATERASYALTELDPSPELLAQAATLMSSVGESAQAVMFWVEAYEKAPDNTTIRNAGGNYIYQQFENRIEGITVEDLQQMNQQHPGSPFLKVMQAHYVMSHNRLGALTNLRREAIVRLLDDALEMDDSFAEAYLIYGNYYDLIGEREQAEESWRYARSFADAPEWVRREANLQIENIGE